mgnify:CR=1 FL=1
MQFGHPLLAQAQGTSPYELNISELDPKIWTTTQRIKQLCELGIKADYIYL